MLLIAAGAQVLALPPLQAATPKKEIADSAITSAVSSGLMFEEACSRTIGCQHQPGHRHALRSVRNILAKERALKMAEEHPGVRGVIDRIA